MAKPAFAVAPLFNATVTADGAASISLADRSGAERARRALQQQHAQSRWLTLGLDQRLIELDRELLPFSEIANKLNEEFHMHMSRNAAIGRAKRMHLPPRTSYRSREIVRHIKTKNKQQTPQPHMIAKPSRKLPPQTPPRNVSLVELGRKDCRYPTVGTAAPFLFCGLPVVENHSWCPLHFRMVYTAARLA